MNYYGLVRIRYRRADQFPQGNLKKAKNPKKFK